MNADENSKLSFDRQQLIDSLNQRPGRMIQLASLLYRQSADPIPYSDNVCLTTVESGLLFYISTHPGVTNATLAKQFGRTKGAISQIIKKLDARGYIVREQSQSDAKTIHLYTSLEGNKIIQAINEYDSNNSDSMLQKLLSVCSPTEVQTFFHMVDLYSAILIQSMDEE